jgi:hypothetical protein
MGTAGSLTSFTVDALDQMLHFLSQISDLTSTVKFLCFYITTSTTLFFGSVDNSSLIWAC